MHRFLVLIRLPLLVCTLIFAMSCRGLERSKSAEEEALEYQNVPGDTLSQENQIAPQPYIDPLFELEGQLCQHVRNIFQDSRGDLWFATNVYGIMRYDGDTLRYFSEADGTGVGRVTEMVEDKEGNVWFGTYGGLTKYDPKAEQAGEKPFTNFTEEDGLLENEIWSLIQDRNGEFWIGTNEGVCRFDGHTFTPVPLPKARIEDTTTIYGYDRITSILEDQYGIFWIGTDGFGITRYDPSSGMKGVTHLTTENGLVDNNVSGLMEDSKGNIWIGSMFGGASLYDPSAARKGANAFTHFTRDGVIEGVEVDGFFEDENGNVWFAVENYGVYRYNGSTFDHLYKNKGLVTNGILCILEDREERFWFGGWMGLFRYDGNSFVSVTREGPWEK